MSTKHSWRISLLNAIIQSLKSAKGLLQGMKDSYNAQEKSNFPIIACLKARIDGIDSQICSIREEIRHLTEEQKNSMISETFEEQTKYLCLHAEMEAMKKFLADHKTDMYKEDIIALEHIITTIEFIIVAIIEVVQELYPSITSKSGKSNTPG